MSRESEVVNHSSNTSFDAILKARLSRRAFLKGVVATAGILSVGSALPRRGIALTAEFAPVAGTGADAVLIPPGYAMNVLLRWGDPLAAGAADFDPRAQTAAKQTQQFGYNADYVAFFPLPYGSGTASRGLLVVNHESVHSEMMWSGWDGRVASKTAEMIETEIAAHGLSVVEIARAERGGWSYVRNSTYNRRITGATPMRIVGPAAFHPLMQTSGSIGGAVLGTLGNCAGGVTPWGTVLTCEENIQNYFVGPLDAIPDAALRAHHQRHGLPAGRFGWERFHERFDLRREPHEPNRFGWIVEFDPYNPGSMPVKHTAMGRFAHEGAANVLAPGGEIVVYSGDDARFEYVYKFISSGRYDSADRRANMQLLHSGTLYTAKFLPDGTGQWLPLVFGRGPLTAANGFRSQAEVLIATRRAADLVGATKMDRPEDIEANPLTGKVYIVLTSNDRRTAEQVDPANPRPDNRWGHIIELVEDGGPTSTRFRWSIFILAGDPKVAGHRASYQGRTDVSPLANPDNLAFDSRGRMYVATDGMEGSLEQRDGVFVVETEGPVRGRSRRFLTVPPGGEATGPEFTPDYRTFFLAIQHPGRSTNATADRPGSRWPDNRTDMPPRASVIAVYREDGGMVGD